MALDQLSLARMPLIGTPVVGQLPFINSGGNGFDLKAGVWEPVPNSPFNPVSVATLDITGLGAYRRLWLSGYLLPATLGALGMLRTDANGGASPDAGASDYSWEYQYANSTTQQANNILATYLPVGFAMHNSVNYGGVVFDIVLDNFNKTTNCWFRCTFGQYNTASIPSVAQCFGVRADVTARDAVRLLFDTGNIALGNVDVFGRRG